MLFLLVASQALGAGGVPHAESPRALPSSAPRAARRANEGRSVARAVIELLYHVHWPAPTFVHPDEPLVIGIVGETTLRGKLEDVAEGRRLDGHPLVVEWYPSLGERGRPHVLIVSASCDRTMSRLRAATGVGVLLVGERARFAEDGGAVGLVEVAGRGAFALNRATLEEDGFRVEPELLELALRVVSSRTGRHEGVSDGGEVGASDATPEEQP